MNRLFSYASETGMAVPALVDNDQDSRVVVYEAFLFRRPNCGGEMRILAFITDAPTVRDLITHRGKTAPPCCHGPRLSALKPSL